MPCYGDGRINADACLCGERKLNDVQTETCLHHRDQYYVLCNDPQGCACGDARCPMSSYCSDNQCIDPLTEQPLNPASGKLGLSASCIKDSCPCGNATCKTGEFCNGVACSDKVFANILHGQRYIYDDRLLKANEERYQDGDEQVDWNWIQSCDMSELNPDNLPLDEYAFTPKYNKYNTDDCEALESVFFKDQMRCMLDSGCQCGDHTCPWGAECIKEECIYDKRFIGTLFSDNERWFDDHEDVFGKGNLIYCHGTAIILKEPVLKSKITDNYEDFKFETEFECDDSGWQCQKSECRCGNKLCALNAYCIHPGVCTGYAASK
ncbi:MAG: hypothetical protein IJM59_13450 [Proteobacteria bacterium]|nr:hypothetical protein [Pseudomonadota bacterium]